VNDELSALYRQDQADRRDGLIADIQARDERRRRRVEELVAAGALSAAEDYFHAAMVFQHGSRREHYRRAHEMAERAVELGCRRARWLAAAAHDRWLMVAGLPQKYGTQYRADGDRWVLWEVDPTTTDQERADWDVPPLAEARRQAKEMSRRFPPGRAPSS
jgi:hypothetical protein